MLVMHQETNGSRGWSTTRLSVTKALWETFPVGPEDADTQRRFEVDRTASISRAGKLTGAENPNGKSRLITGRSLYHTGH